VWYTICAVNWRTCYSNDLNTFHYAGVSFKTVTLGELNTSVRADRKAATSFVSEGAGAMESREGRGGTKALMPIPIITLTAHANLNPNIPPSLQPHHLPTLSIKRNMAAPFITLSELDEFPGLVGLPIVNLAPQPNPSIAARLLTHIQSGFRRFSAMIARIAQGIVGIGQGIAGIGQGIAGIVRGIAQGIALSITLGIALFV